MNLKELLEKHEEALKFPEDSSYADREKASRGLSQDLDGIEQFQYGNDQMLEFAQIVSEKDYSLNQSHTLAGIVLRRALLEELPPSSSEDLPRKAFLNLFEVAHRHLDDETLSYLIDEVQNYVGIVGKKAAKEHLSSLYSAYHRIKKTVEGLKTPDIKEDPTRARAYDDHTHGLMLLKFPLDDISRIVSYQPD